MLKLIWAALLAALVATNAVSQTAVKPAAKPSVAAAPVSADKPAAVPATPNAADTHSAIQSQSGLPPLGEPSTTKTFEVKYADPEEIRQLFSGRSFVVEANRDLGVLTASGSAEFLKEVEDAVKRFDVPPPAPANLQISVYLLTVAAQAPAGGVVPQDLTAIIKDISPPGGQALRVADCRLIRLREGQAGESTGVSATPDAASIARVRLKNTAVSESAKGDLISLNGLQIWLAIPGAQPRTDADVLADVDLAHDSPAVISKAGVDKPVIVIIKASVAK